MSTTTFSTIAHPVAAPAAPASEGIAARINLLAVLTVVTLLLHPPGIWYTQAPLIAVLICGLVRRELVSLPAYWLAISGLIALDLMVGWFYVDNHKFVELHWCLALFCATAVEPDIRERVLKLNGRLIIGFVMGFAVLWKAISLSYMSGSFFEYVLITDERFANMAHWFGGMSYETLTQNRATLTWVKSAHLDGIHVGVGELVSSQGIRWLALAMTWWTIGIEAVVSLLYFLPSKIKHMNAIRDYTLLGFAVTTYLFAPVVGFGWLLMILGISQSESQTRVRLFCFVFVLIQIYEMPYGHFVNRLLGS